MTHTGKGVRCMGPAKLG